MDRIIERDCLEYIDDIDLSPMAGKTVLVTGANGLIGTYIICFLHLANLCKNLNIKIIAVSKHMPSIKFGGMFDVLYKFYPLDLTSDSMENLPKADYIIHGATYAQPEIFMKNYSETIHLNVFSTENLLRKAKKDGAKFLFLSSSEVYGSPGPDNIPTAEAYPGLCSPLSVRSVYAESKRLGETLCSAYKSYEKLDVKIARIFMTYGPGLSIHDKRVMGQFINEALLEHEITMLDDGSKLRTFCYAADCIIMLLYVLLYGKSFVYNVGGRDCISIKRLAEEICSITGSTLTVGKSKVLNEGDVRISPDIVKPDISKIASESGFTYFMPLIDGLQRTIVWNLRQFF